MGNCSQKSSAVTANKATNFIRIMTDAGRIMELQGPKMARDVLDIFPGYGIYQRDRFSLPLFEDEVLRNGQIYYLLPFGVSKRVSETRSTSSNGSASFRRDQNSAFEVLPSSGNGVWRVKMAIDSKELEEMLSPENAEALIEMMRSAAKSSSPMRRSFGWRRSSMSVISCGFKSTGVLMV